MSIGIGVIGAGVMGGDHARTIATAVGGAHLAAIADADQARAAAVASACGGVAVHGDGATLIADPAVDAVLVASPDATHAELVLACLAAGKPVLCEKPLAATAAEAEAILQAETQGGRRRVQVGFMRRFDPAYAAMRARFAAGEIGAAVLLHCLHHNASAPPWFDSAMVISNAAVHEIDVARWLLGQEVTSVSVFAPGDGGAAMRDRLLLVLRMSGGAVVDVGVFVNAGYGYDVRAELVGERGTLTRAPADPVVLRAGGRQGGDFAPDWRAHFAAAYQLQLQAWVRAIRTGEQTGASAWDGYAANLVAAAGIRALHANRPEPVTLPPRPALYR